MLILISDRCMVDQYYTKIFCCTQQSCIAIFLINPDLGWLLSVEIMAKSKVALFDTWHTCCLSLVNEFESGFKLLLTGQVVEY